MANATPNAKNMQDAASSAADKARETASHVADKAKEFGRSAASTAESATSKVGGGFENMADRLRESAPREGMMHNAANRVADSLERSGRYLQEEGLSGMAEDLTSVIKRYPVPAVLVGIGVGYLIAHALRR